MEEKEGSNTRTPYVPDTEKWMPSVMSLFGRRDLMVAAAIDRLVHESELRSEKEIAQKMYYDSKRDYVKIKRAHLVKLMSDELKKNK